MMMLTYPKSRLELMRLDQAFSNPEMRLVLCGMILEADGDIEVFVHHFRETLHKEANGTRSPETIQEPTA